MVTEVPTRTIVRVAASNPRVIAKTRVNSNLENIEFIETFNGREEFIFLARLSQEKYYDTLHKKSIIEMFFLMKMIIF